MRNPWKRREPESPYQLFLERLPATETVEVTRSGEYLAWTDSKGLLALIREEEFNK